jgi:hypothetical protein
MVRSFSFLLGVAEKFRGLVNGWRALGNVTALEMAFESLGDLADLRR